MSLNNSKVTNASQPYQQGILSPKQSTATATETKREKEILARYVLIANEFDRLNALNHQLIRENEALRVKGSQEQSSNVSKVPTDRENDLKAKLNAIIAENDRLNELVKSLSQNEGFIEMERKIRILVAENNRIAQLLEGAVNENTVLKHRISQIESAQVNTGINSEIERLRLEVNKWKAQVVENDIQAYQAKELQTKLHALSVENEKLREQILYGAQYSQRVEGTRAELEQLKLIISQKNSELSRLRKQYEDAYKELQEIRGSSQPSEGSKAHLTDLQNKLRLIVADNENLYEENCTLIAKANEADSFASQKAQLESQISYYRSEVERLAVQITQRGREADEGLAARQRLSEVENALKAAYSENQRLSIEFGEARRELDSAHLALGQVEALNQKIEQLTQENERLSSRFVETQRDYEKLKVQVGESNNLLKKLTESESQIRFLNENIIEKIRIQEELRARVTQLKHEGVSAKALDEKLAFVIADNSRLSNQLAERAAEIEGYKLKNYQSDQLLSQVADLQRKLTVILEENDRLNDAVIEKEKELEELNVKLYSVEDLQARVKFLQEEIERQRRDTEALRNKLSAAEGAEAKIYELTDSLNYLRQEKQRLERELGEAHSKLVSVESLEVEIRSKMEAEKRLEIESARAEIQKRFGLERQTLEGAIAASHKKTADLEDKIYQLLEENDKLSAAIRERLSEVEAYKSHYLELEKAKAEEIELLKHQHESRLRYEIAKSEDELLKYKSSFGDIERKYNLLVSEYEGLKASYKYKFEEAEEWKKKHYDQEILRYRELEDFKQQFETYKRSNIDSRDFQLKFNAERAAYEAQILQLHQKVQDYEKQINQLLAEMEKHSMQSLEKAKEVDSWRGKLLILEEKHKAEITDLRSKLEYFKSSNYDVKQLSIKYGSDKASDQSQIKQLKQMVENYKEEVDKLYELISQRKSDHDKLQAEFESVNQAYVQAKEKLQFQESGEIEEKLNALQKEIRRLEESRDQFQKQAEKNSLELTKKNRELVDKIQELDLLKIKYEDALNNYQNLSSKLFEKLMEGDKRNENYSN